MRYIIYNIWFCCKIYLSQIKISDKNEKFEQHISWLIQDENIWQYEKKSQRKNGEAMDKTYQESVAASECSR